MRKNITKVTTKGQVVIPKEFRDKFKIKPSTRVLFEEKDGMLVMEPLKKYTPSSGKGIIKSNKRLTINQMNKAVEKGVLDRYNKSLKKT